MLHDNLGTVLGRDRAIVHRHGVTSSVRSEGSRGGGGEAVIILRVIFMYNCSVAMTRLVALGASDFLTIVSLISMMIAVLMFSRHLGSMLRRVHRGIVAVVLVVVRHGSSKRSLERGVHDLLLYCRERRISRVADHRVTTGGVICAVTEDYRLY